MSMDFKRRLIGLQKKMEDTDLDLVVYGSCANFQYITGILMERHRGTGQENGVNNVYVPREGQPILTLTEDEASSEDSRTWIKDIRTFKKGENYGELVDKVISNIDLKGSEVGMGDHVWGSTTVEIAKSIKNAKLRSAEMLMDDLRMIKDSEEVERLRKTAELTDKVMEAVIPKIKEGVTQRELGLIAEFEGKRLVDSDPAWAFAGFVKSGSEVSPNPFTYPKDKGLVHCTSIAFDIGFVLDGYCSDFGRSFYFGPANTEVKRGYEALHQGMLETVDKMHDGSMCVSDLFPTIEKTLDRLGYGNYFRARLPGRDLGHNIGIEGHEPPWLNPSYSETLRTNMVMALEPKVWHAGEYYLRLEDIIRVGPRKAEFLTNFDRNLFQI